MALSPDLHQEIDTGRQVDSTQNMDKEFLAGEIERVKHALSSVEEALQELPAAALVTLPFSQIIIRNQAEVNMMSEGDILQEMANVTAAIMRCDQLIDDETVSDEVDMSLESSMRSISNQLQLVSTRESADDDGSIYCLCRLPYSATRSMIQCDFCDNWFHLICTGISLLCLPNTYQCPQCHPVPKRRRHSASNDDMIPDDITQPEVDIKLCAKGVEWLQEEVARVESEIAEVVVDMDGVAANLLSVEKKKKNRTSRSARKLANAFTDEYGPTELHEGPKQRNGRSLNPDLTPIGEHDDDMLPLSSRESNLFTYPADEVFFVQDDINGELLGKMVIDLIHQFGLTQASVADEMMFPGGASALSATLRGYSVAARPDKEALLRRWLAVFRTKASRGEVTKPVKAIPQRSGSGRFSLGAVIEFQDSDGSWHQAVVEKLAKKRIRVAPLTEDAQGRIWLGLKTGRVAPLGTHTEIPRSPLHLPESHQQLSRVGDVDKAREETTIDQAAHVDPKSTIIPVHSIAAVHDPSSEHAAEISAAASALLQLSPSDNGAMSSDATVPDLPSDTKKRRRSVSTKPAPSRRSSRRRS